MKKEAFTLAEVMIVLTVIGIISAIIMPIALHSVPDENVLKFKKANATIYQVINELVNSDKYYKDGDLGIKADGTMINGSHTGDYTYFCNTFSDIISTKKQTCKDTGQTSSTVGTLCHVGLYWDVEKLGEESVLKIMDKKCKNTQSTIGEEIVSTDGITYWQECPKAPFGTYWYWKKDENGEVVEYGLSETEEVEDKKIKRLFSLTNNYNSKSDFDEVYKVFCVDVDGINKGIDPFGYGIRADGKILLGALASEWLEKDIQGE